MSISAANPHTFGPLEAELIAWLERERPSRVDADMIIKALGWPRRRVHQALQRLQRKGVLKRGALGRYEPLLGDRPLVAADASDPWAALGAWDVPRYVGLASAAYEHGLALDRPRRVQTYVAAGRERPKTWSRVLIQLIHLPKIELDGVVTRELHGFPVPMSGIERTLLDCATVPARAGGALGLARTVDRSLDRTDWLYFVTLSRGAPRGRPAARRIAAIVEALGRTVPRPLEQFAGARPGDQPLYVDGPARGRDGTRLPRWGAVLNVSADALRAEAERT